MGIRYYKRINYGDGLGLNVSKSGVSPSIRTNSGSVSTKGFSIRTGIPGLSFRGGLGKNSAVFWLLLLVIAGGFIILYNVVRYVAYILSIVYMSIFREQGINYSNLLILLSLLLIVLMIVYYYI